MSGRGAEGVDPWGFRMPPTETLVFCDYVAPNGLPCTCRKSGHPSAHFTSDGRSWPDRPDDRVVTPEPVADDRPDYYADQQAWREQRATAPDAAQWEALANALREIGPQPGGVMHPDLVADRLLDHEWFAQACERKQAEANRVPEPVADDRARVIAGVLEGHRLAWGHDCSCGWKSGKPYADTTTRRLHQAHVAAVLAQRAAADPRIEAIRALVRSPQADKYRDEACRNAVDLPYASNRYVRLLDDLRAALGDQP